ncbi:MAG: hypothetical protein JNJ77_10240 [Planctomycetia bacterium]|nr:hypothetical protein [Planctomycetia bacterium]
MLTILISWMLVSFEPVCKLPPVPTNHRFTAGIKIIELPFTFTPEWQVTTLAKKEFLVGESTNFENWHKREQVSHHLELTPVEKPDNYIRARNSMKLIVDCLDKEHRPWQLAYQRVFTLFESCIGKFLYYEIIKNPSTERPYYVAFVRSMPNIRCKATTIAELEQQLVQKYKEYLLRLVEESDLIKMELDEAEPDWDLPPIHKGFIARKRFAF